MYEVFSAVLVAVDILDVLLIDISWVYLQNVLISTYKGSAHF